MGLREIEEVYRRLDGIVNDGGHLLYHYRSLEGFWNIIEGDCFWATNARFSNDEEEQRLGIKKIKDLYWEGKPIPGNIDCYIVCFCEEDDKLSQWRGYAQNGISIGFDFSNIRPFYIMHIDEKEDEKIIYNACAQVAYFDLETNSDTVLEWTRLVKNEYSVDTKRWDRFLLNRIPFIKHKGFEEEEEYRLVFEGEELGPYIRYRNSDNMKLPYIVVKAGSNIKRDDVIIRVLFDTSSDDGKSCLKCIKDSLSTRKKIKVIECQNMGVSVNEKDCEGCIRTRKIDLESECIDEWSGCPGLDGYCFIKENAIIISDCKDQEEIFMSLHYALHEKFGEMAPKIWCEGHLPVRSITVGPSRDSDRVRESIEHYCRHKAYWLMDVEIKKSKIPYRS